jgi:HEAT repeat protein
VQHLAAATTMATQSLTLRAATGALVLFLAACSSTKDATAGNPGDGRWIRASPMLEQQIEDAAAQLPWAKGLQRLELIRFFATLGEPAYETLLELAADERTSVAASAYSALGATGDGRLVDAINEIPFDAQNAPTDLALERARTLARLGDWRNLPVLIRGLEDERLYTRALCAQALQETTGETIEYDPRASAAQRALGVEAWERWWLKYSGQPMPPRPAPAVQPTPVLED